MKIKKFSAVLIVIGVVVLHLAMIRIMSIASRPRALAAKSAPAPIEAILITPVPVPPTSEPVNRPAMKLRQKAPSTSIASRREAPRADGPPTAAPMPPSEQPADPPSSAPASPPPSSNSPPLRLELPTKRWQSLGPGSNPHVDDAASSIQADESRATKPGLTQEIEAAGKDDCMKGKFKGSGMGLLSLPGLALSAMNGRCR